MNASLPAPLPAHRSVWIITEGLVGTENQCIGIAEAMGVTPIVKRVALRQPWKFLSPYLGLECALTFSEPLNPPYPDILITSGRKAIAASRYIKKKSDGKTFTVHVQDPRINPKQFDKVVVPQHDPTRGENVIVTVATPNRITQDRLNTAHAEFAPVFARMGSPRLAVLIGGSTKRHQFTRDEAKALAEKLLPMKNMMITTSRRTGADNTDYLKTVLSPQNYFYDTVSPNPYMGMLAWADVILVTADSTAMISEAATTGKPVYVLPMKGLTKRQAQLVENLKTHGAVRIFEGYIAQWDYPPLNDAETVAKSIIKGFSLFTFSPSSATS